MVAENQCGGHGMKDCGSLQVATPTDREIVITRGFNASRELVYNAWTRPEMLKRWLFGPDGWTLAVCDMDLRPGGAFRWLWRGPDGTEMGMRGVYREVLPPQRIVHTEIFDQDWTGGETLVTTTFHEQADKTTVVITILYASREARDGALQSGMKEGMEMGYARLEKMLASM